MEWPNETSEERQRRKSAILKTGIAIFNLKPPINKKVGGGRTIQGKSIGELTKSSPQKKPAHPPFIASLCLISLHPRHFACPPACRLAMEENNRSNRS
jgi:hypothetical protein